mmetsp:Transcript_14512/g.61125  ORF Transcript_14512/g.61125 Transcript_14512/m.61125 type:complete len:207 (+) Transcript_14512:910-1530(+)
MDGSRSRHRFFPRRVRRCRDLRARRKRRRASRSESGRRGNKSKRVDGVRASPRRRRSRARVRFARFARRVFVFLAHEKRGQRCHRDRQRRWSCVAHRERASARARAVDPRGARRRARLGLGARAVGDFCAARREIRRYRRKKEQIMRRQASERRGASRIEDGDSRRIPRDRHSTRAGRFDRVHTERRDEDERGDFPAETRKNRRPV